MKPHKRIEANELLWNQYNHSTYKEYKHNQGRGTVLSKSEWYKMLIHLDIVSRLLNPTPDELFEIFRTKLFDLNTKYITLEKNEPKKYPGSMNLAIKRLWWQL